MDLFRIATELQVGRQRGPLELYVWKVADLAVIVGSRPTAGQGRQVSGSRPAQLDRDAPLTGTTTQQCGGMRSAARV
jgi:hypothetical protein